MQSGMGSDYQPVAQHDEEAGPSTTAANIAGAGLGLGLGAAARSQHSHGGSRGGHSQSQSGSHSHSGESRGTVSSGGLFYNPSGPASPRSGMTDIHEEAEVATAQRGVRSPLARIARLSWFTGNRQTRGSSMLATGPTTDNEDEEGWIGVNNPRTVRRRSLHGPAPLLAPPPASARRGSQSATALVSPPASPPAASTSPPPMSYFNLGKKSVERRHSAKTSKSGNSSYRSAPSQPGTPGPSGQQPPQVGTPSAESALNFPRFSPTPGAEGENSTSPEGPDVLDWPVPPRYTTTSTSSAGQLPLAKNWLALGVGEDVRSRSESDVSRGARHLVTLRLDDPPPPPADSWRNRLGGASTERSDSVSRRLTLGPVCSSCFMLQWVSNSPL